MARDQVPPLDEATLVAVAAALLDATRAGKSLPEELNRRGLILTKARREDLAVAGLEQLRLALHVWMPAEMLRKVNRSMGSATPADMYAAVTVFVEEMITHIKQKGL